MVLNYHKYKYNILDRYWCRMKYEDFLSYEKTKAKPRLIGEITYLNDIIFLQSKIHMVDEWANYVEYSNHDEVQLLEWCIINCKFQYRFWDKHHIVFENVEDALLFKLIWS